MNKNIRFGKYLFCLLTLILAPTTPQGVFGQTAADPCQNLPRDLVGLADKRSQVQKDIEDDSQAIKDLPTKIDQAKKYEQDLSDVNRKIQALKDHPPSDTNAYQQQSDNLSKLKEQTEKLLVGKSSEIYAGQQQNALHDLADKRDQLRCIEKGLYSASSPDQTFKLVMSGIFAFLILAVIAGFYRLTGKDEQMRRAIFSGQEGIQFLTLFSLVIAIILFGIIGILQDKELAALLGGLSGYILGRYNSPGQQPGGAVPPPAPALPAPAPPVPAPPSPTPPAPAPLEGEVVIPTPDPEDAESHIDGCEVDVQDATLDEELPAAEGGVA